MKSNLILALDTSSYQSSMTILSEEKILVSQTISTEKQLSESLIGELQSVLLKNLINKKQINLIAVATGPGNFTGIRLGIAAAKGLAFSLKCPITGYSLFDGETVYKLENSVLAIALSKTILGWKYFSAENRELDGKFEKIDYRNLPEVLKKIDYKQIFIDEYTFDLLTQDKSKDSSITGNLRKIERNSSYFLARRALNDLDEHREFTSGLKVIY